MVTGILAETKSFQDKLLQAVSLCAEKPHELLDEYFSQAALEDHVLIGLFNESVNEIRLSVLADFIESGKAEGAIDASVSTDTILDFLQAASSVQSNWKNRQEHKQKSKELYHLILYGLIGT